MDWEAQCPECGTSWTVCPCCDTEFCPKCWMPIEFVMEMALAEKEDEE